MKSSILSVALIALSTLGFAANVSAKETVVNTNTASCNYAPSNIKVTKDGQQNYKITCLRETKAGYQVFTYGVGKDQSTKLVFSGKNQLQYNFPNQTVKDGNKVVFSYKGTNIRSAVSSDSKNAVFTSKVPTLAQFNGYFDKYQICAQ